MSLRERLAARQGTPWVGGHRGDAERAPENTLPAFEAAITSGARLIECDVHLTADGRLAVIHDHRVDRTTDGTGPVDGMTLAELRGLDAGSWFGPAFRGTRVPELSEVLALARDRCGVVVEVKTWPNARGDPVTPLLRTLRETGMWDEVVVVGFDHRLVAAVARTAPGLLCGLNLAGRPLDPAGLCRAAGATVLGAEWESADAALGPQLHQAGMHLLVWTVDDQPALELARAAAADAVLTNRPSSLRA